MKLGDKFLSLAPEARALVFEQAAAGLAGQAVILEKDSGCRGCWGCCSRSPNWRHFWCSRGARRDFVGGPPRPDGCLARHCERSAAIQAVWIHGLLHCVRNDEAVHGKRSVAVHEVRGHGLPRRFAPRNDGGVHGKRSVAIQAVWIH